MNPENFIADHVKNLPRSGIRDFFAIVSEMPQAISLGIGEPDFVTPWKIREASIFALEKGKTSYTDNRGLLSLRKEISRYVSSFFGPEEWASLKDWELRQPMNASRSSQTVKDM